MNFTKGKYSFIVATHIDKEHIHNHIIFNSTSINCDRKFRNFLGSSLAIRKLSDRICLENNLSVIENPKTSKGSYGTWLGNEKVPSHSDILRLEINTALNKSPKNFDDFLTIMSSSGYEIKMGKHIAFKGKNQKKFIRLRSLGSGYSEQEIKDIIYGKTIKRDVKSNKKTPEKPIDLLVDIQAKLNSGKGKGYEQLAKIFNLKQMAQTINFLRENDLLSYEELEKKATDYTEQFDELNSKIKTSEKRMAEIQVLKKHIINYMNTRDVYVNYRKSGYSKKFYSAHESEIILHKAAKKAFNDLETKKLPKIKDLQIEYSELLSEKKVAYMGYKTAKKQMQDTLNAKANVKSFLNIKDAEKTKEKSQER